MWNFKGNDANELIYKTETDSQTQRTQRTIAGWQDWGRIGEKGSLEVLDGPVHTALFKMDNQRGPTYCIVQGTLLNVMWQPGWEGSLGENGYMYMYG